MLEGCIMLVMALTFIKIEIMRLLNIHKKIIYFFLIVLLLQSCNKDVEQFTIPNDHTVSGKTLEECLKSNPNDSLYYRLIVKSGQLSLCNSNASNYTLFVTSNDSLKIFLSEYVLNHYGDVLPTTASDSVFSAAINNYVTQEDAAKIILYNTIPQSIIASNLCDVFPNCFYPSAYNPIPSYSAFLRLTTFPTKRNGLWLNEVPIVGSEVTATNGVIHHTSNLVQPPSQYLWERISSDTNLAYLKAAIARADSGTVAPGFMKSALLNIGANLTIFAPTNHAFRTALTSAIAQYFISIDTVPPISAPEAWYTFASALASTPDIFLNTNLFSVLTASRIKGILAYHVLGSRAFTNNFSTDSTYYQTLLNMDTSYTSHPGIQLKGVFGNKYVVSATVKGVGNATPANLMINNRPLTPAPMGTSDQNYLNGVIHKIDQVLLPESL